MMIDLPGLADADSFTFFVDQIRLQTGVDELYVIDHDLASLHSLSAGERTSLNDPALLDSILAGGVVTYESRYFTPIPSRQFPLLVARSESPLVQDSDHNEMIGALASFHRELFDNIESRRRARTFTPAAELQWSMLPVRAVSVGGYDVAGALQPAASVAGDAYDLAIDPAGKLNVCVMDAMGHGVTSTLSTALALATIRTVRIDGGTLVEQVCAADEAILGEYEGSRFVTMVAVLLSDDGMSVVNAGHEPIRLVSRDDEVETLSIPADPPLGLEGRTDYRLHTLAPLQPGESLALISDGASGSKDTFGETFGSGGVNRALSELRGESSLQTADRFGRAVMNFIDGDLRDDLTTVIVRRTI